MEKIENISLKRAKKDDLGNRISVKFTFLHKYSNKLLKRQFISI